MDLIHHMYNASKAWASTLSRRLDGDRMLAAMSDTASNIITAGLRDPGMFEKLDGFIKPPRRTLEQLREQGYVVKPRKRDPFTPSEMEKLDAALKR